MPSRFSSSLLTFALLVAALLVVADYSFAQAPILFRWKLKAGDKLPLSVTEELRVTQKAKDGDALTTISQQFDLTWTVGETDAQGLINISQRIDRIRGKVVQGGTDAGSFDSAGSAPAAGLWSSLAPVLKSMIGVEFILKMNARGEIFDVTVPPEVVAAVAKSPKLGQLQGYFSADGMKQLIGASLVVLPEEAIPAGHAWVVARRARNPLAGPQMVTAAFTYVGPEQRVGRQLQKITVDLDTLPDQSASVNPKSQAATVKEQDGQGAVYFDSTAGRVVEAELRQTAAMTITLGAESVDQQVETVVRVTTGK